MPQQQQPATHQQQQQQQHSPSSNNIEVQRNANWNGTCLIAPRCGVNFVAKAEAEAEAETIGQLVSYSVSQFAS